MHFNPNSKSHNFILFYSLLQLVQPAERHPRYSSPQNHGESVQNMLQSAERFQEILRLDIDSFRKLVSEIKKHMKDGRAVKVEEKCIIGLHWLSTSHVHRQQANLFNRGVATVKRAREEFIKAVIMEFKNGFEPGEWIRRADPNAVMETGRPYARWFSGCIGAMDGTHVAIRVPDEYQQRYRNRKGYISTNVMAVCDFRMRITFIHPGVCAFNRCYLVLITT